MVHNGEKNKNLSGLYFTMIHLDSNRKERTYELFSIKTKKC